MPCRSSRAWLIVFAGAVVALTLVPPEARGADPWQVGDTAQSGQWTLYPRTAEGSGLGLPVAAGDLNGDGFDDVVIAPMNAASGPQRQRSKAGELIIVFGRADASGIFDLAPLDPQALPPLVTLVYGAREFDYLGTEVGAADVNADGFVDLIAGAQHGDGPGDEREDAGEAVIVWGRADLGGQVIDLATPPENGAVTFLYGRESGERFGTWVSAGDFDGDGTPDVIVGADQNDGPDGQRPHAGATYVIYGGDLRSHAAIDLAAPEVDVTVVYGIDVEDHSGCLVRADDVDGDDVADLLIGAGLNRLSSSSDSTGGFSGHGIGGGDGPDGTRQNAGEAYVVFGERGVRPAAVDLRTPPESTAVIYGSAPDDSYGEEIVAGDFDGNGVRDLAIGALTAGGPDNDRANAGEMALVGGGSGLRGRVIDLAEPPADVTIFYGAARAIAGDTGLFGDFDRDGYDDLAIGVPRAAPGGRGGAGAVYVVYGRSEALPPLVDLSNPPPELGIFTIEGNEPGDLLCYSAYVGDVNGDGFLDAIINAMGADGFDDLLTLAGDMYVIDGRRLSEAAGRVVVDNTPTETPTTEPTVTETPSATPSATASSTPTPTVMPATASPTPSASPSSSPTSAPSSTATPSVTSSPVDTATQSVTPTTSVGGSNGGCNAGGGRSGSGAIPLLALTLLAILRRRMNGSARPSPEPRPIDSSLLALPSCLFPRPCSLFPVSCSLSPSAGACEPHRRPLP